MGLAERATHTPDGYELYIDNEVSFKATHLVHALRCCCKHRVFLRQLVLQSLPWPPLSSVCCCLNCCLLLS